jgi:hypothetical protein
MRIIFRSVSFTLLVLISLALGSPLAGAQTTSGQVTGRVLDHSGAVIVGAEIDITNVDTAKQDKTFSGKDGLYLLPQLPAGNYRVLVKKEGFASQERPNIRLEVNQSVTLDADLTVSSTNQVVTVDASTPALNTISATLGNVIDHNTTVDLPLNGREFTQLALLTPGAAPVENGQQRSYTISLGAGGISPSVNGQRGYQNNFTMDGVLNNAVYTNTWIIAPPPDAIQEFNVQSHITDAQFGISSGANINLVTRAGTNSFHGALWEFIRNDALDAQTYPQTTRLPYRQNQYGLFLGGPVIIPHLINGKDHTWFSGYWEGFRADQSNAYLASVLTSAMRSGDFLAVLGPQTGTDSLGRPIYKNEIFDPTTSRLDPTHPGQYLRDPFPGNKITSGINPASLAILSKYYPLPNLNVPDGTLPNYTYNGKTTTLSDVFGVRIDHSFANNDSIFLRLSRTTAHLTTPRSVPTYNNATRNYAQVGALGYTHAFNASTILNFHYAYSYVNYSNVDQAAGTAFTDSINFSQAFPERYGRNMGPGISIANGYTGLSQTQLVLGPLASNEWHLDLLKTIGSHTIGAGGMYYNIHALSDGPLASPGFTQNGTAQYGQTGPSGYGPASFLLGVVDNYSAKIGNTAANQTIPWYGVYAQDQWQVSPKLVLTAGLRWDYIAPPNYHKIVSALDILTGELLVTAPILPYYPKANAPSGYFYPQYNGFQPRFGITYRAASNIVIHSAFAVIDDHNNNLVQENQQLRGSWPSSAYPSLTSQDLGQPKLYIDNLPSAASFLDNQAPRLGQSANPHNPIPYAMEYNLGVEQQLSDSLVMKLDYVGSVGRHQYIDPTVNTALNPGPGAISPRQPFPQYPIITYGWNTAPSSYNALQAQLKKSISKGLFFLASYTYSKSLDWQSDPYSNSAPNFYNLKTEWGPSDYNRTQMLVLSGSYLLPVGRGGALLSHTNGVTQTLVGDWTVGSIITLNSGAPFYVLAGGDVANTGGPNQRAQRTGQNPYASSRSAKAFLNKTAFAVPTAYTFGNEGRNDLVGPTYKNVDFNLSKTFPVEDLLKVQFRAESFNIFNKTNYSNPDSGVQDGSFGQILSAAGPGRQIQFALKILF